MSGHKLPPPPGDLSQAMENYWQQVNETFALEPHHLRLLELACRAYDQAERCRVHLMIRGDVYVDRWGQPKQRPEVAIQQQARRDFARFVRDLGLASAEPD
jgi:phage terminase small subunit